MSGIEVAFFGSIVRDAESKTSKTGKAYLKFSVRVGETDSAQWVSVMLFGDDVPELAGKLTKGCRIYIEGSLRLDTWEQQDGTKRSGLGVMSWHGRLAHIGKNKPKRSSSAADTAQHNVHAPTSNDFDDPLPF